MTGDLERFEDFRAGIDLEHYRYQYRRIKIVEPECRAMCRIWRR